MTDGRTTDEALLRYLDGALPADEADALEARLQEDTALQARLQALDPIAGAVRDTFDAVPGPARRGALARALPEARPPKAERGLTRLAMVAVLAGAISIGVTSWWMRPAPLTWQEQVALYQVLYTPDTVAPLQATPEELAAQFARAAAALERPLAPAPLTAFDGFDLKRAQILGLDGAPLVQIVFAGPGDTPVALCILRMDAAPQAPEATVLSGLQVVSWAEAGHAFMVVGALEPSRLRSLAAGMRSVL